MATSFTTTYNGALAASTVLKLTSANRWQYIRITNFGAATGTAAGENADLIYITTDNATTPAAGADGGWAAAPGETIIVPNNQALWWQGFGGPGGSIDTVGLKNPTIDPPQTATTASAPNPGTSVWLLGASGSTPSFTVEGAG